MLQLDASRGIFGNLIFSTRQGNAWSVFKHSFWSHHLRREEFIMATLPYQALLSNVHLPHGLVGMCHGFVGDLHIYIYIFGTIL